MKKIETDYNCFLFFVFLKKKVFRENCGFSKHFFKVCFCCLQRLIYIML